jgi:hypothetical protein
MATCIACCDPGEKSIGQGIFLNVAGRWYWTMTCIRAYLMTITVGQLVSQFFTAYDREFHDEELAAVATQVRIMELLERTVRARPRRLRRPAA